MSNSGESGRQLTSTFLHYQDVVYLGANHVILVTKEAQILTSYKHGTHNWFFKYKIALGHYPETPVCVTSCEVGFYQGEWTNFCHPYSPTLNPVFVKKKKNRQDHRYSLREMPRLNSKLCNILLKNKPGL